MKAAWLLTVVLTVFPHGWVESQELARLGPAVAAASMPSALVRLASGSSDDDADDEEDPPTAKSAKEFVTEVEEALDQISGQHNRISWMRAIHITADTDWLESAAAAEAARMKLDFAKRAARFDGIAVDPVTRRKLQKIKLAAWLLAPDRDDAADELADSTTELDSRFSTATVPHRGRSLPRDEAEELLGKTREPDELETLWTAMRHNLPPMRKSFEQAVALANEGARELGFKDTGDMWRAAYDMPPDAFAALIERLWKQVEPLYKKMHCYYRARLNDTHGDTVQPRTGPIRNHLLSQKWETSAEIFLPKSEGASIDLTRLLTDKAYDVQGLFKTGEAFFTSLGFAPLPKAFWERSMFTRPRDREVACWAYAWHIDVDDVRVTGCYRVNAEDFYTAHHELGHIYYYLATSHLDSLFADGANDGFHEAVGDFVALSAQTQTYLRQIGLVDANAPAESDIGHLMRMLHAHGAAMAAYLASERWRWDVFAGKIAPSQYNDTWWQYRLKYLGIVPPSPRPADAFDPGASQTIAAFVPGISYFLAEVYQFQFHRAACRIAGWTGPLHRCSIYGNKQVGARFQAMLRMGTSKPWPDALEAFTGERDADARAMLDYFAPLDRWLTEQNKGETCGW